MKARAPIHYLVGTPCGRLSRLEQAFPGQPWEQARGSVQVKLLAQDDEVCILAKSEARRHKERGMRQRKLKRLWARLQALQDRQLTRGQLLLKQRARALAPGLTPTAALERFRALQMVDVHLPTTDGRVLELPRYTQPEKDVQLLLKQLHLTLPEQPPPKIKSADIATA